MKKPEPSPRSVAAFTRRGFLSTAAAVAATTALPEASPAQAFLDPKDHRPYRAAATRTVQYLVRKMKKDGSYGREAPDLASYYKTPWLMLIGGRHHRAYRSLGHIERTFLRPDGDFLTRDGLKSENPALSEFWPYTNAWIAMGAQKTGRFDLARPAYDYLRSFFHQELGGFTLHAPYGSGDNVVGGFITAHLGLTSLYFGELDRARRAGDFLCRLLRMQPDLAAGLYLRVDDGGSLITEYPADLERYHLVKTRERYQHYYLVGHPLGFLAKLYEATAEAKYLEGARAYLDFALSCHRTLLSYHLSHAVGWGAAVLARITESRAARSTALSIVGHLASLQEHSGAWFPNEPAYLSFDRTAENALFMLDVSAEIVDSLSS